MSRVASTASSAPAGNNDVPSVQSVDNSLLTIGEETVSMNEAIMRLTQALNGTSVENAAIAFAQYAESETLDEDPAVALECLIGSAHSRSNKFLLPLRGFGTSQGAAPSVVSDKDGNPLKLTLFGAISMKSKFTSVNDYGDMRASDRKYGVPITESDLFKMGYRMTFMFAVVFGDLPEFVRQRSVTTQHMISLLEEAIEEYYSKGPSIQASETGSFLRSDEDGDAVIQAITYPFFYRNRVRITGPSKKTASSSRNLSPMKVSPSKNSATLLNTLGGIPATGLSNEELSGPRTLKEMPDPDSYYEVFLDHNPSLDGLIFHVPPVYGEDGRLIHPISYSEEIPHECFVRAEIIFQLYQFSDKKEIKRALQCRIARLDLLPTTAEGIIKKYPELVCDFIAIFEKHALSLESPPLFEETLNLLSNPTDDDVATLSDHQDETVVVGADTGTATADDDLTMEVDDVAPIMSPEETLFANERELSPLTDIGDASPTVIDTPTATTKGKGKRQLASQGGKRDNKRQKGNA